MSMALNPGSNLSECWGPAVQSLIVHPHLTESAYKVVLQESIPAQIRQLILCISNDKG